jgi:serine/threonine protein kinase
MAPECVHNKNNVSKAADVWSLGCILYQLLTGLLPFRGASDYLIFRRSIEAKVNLDLPHLIPEQAVDLIKLCLKTDPLERPTVEQVLEHPFCQQALAQRPDIQGWQLTLREVCDDWIAKANVHQFDGE